MFNKNILEVLNQFNAMTNSVILRYPETVLISDGGDIMVQIPMKDLDPDQFPEIPLNNSLNEMLNLFKLFGDERSIEFENNTINISNDKSNSTFITDNVALMESYDKDNTQFQRTESVPYVASFELDEETIKEIKSATGVFKDLDEILFTSQDSDMNISLGATNKFNAKSHTYSVKKDAETTKEFTIKIPVDNFKMLPLSNYQCNVYYNANKDSYRILLKNKSVQNLKILMTVKV